MLRALRRFRQWLMLHYILASSGQRLTTPKWTDEDEAKLIKQLNERFPRRKEHFERW